MQTPEFKESTKPLLRQDQIAESEKEIERLGGMLDGPDFIKSKVENRPMVQQMLRNITHDLETQRPTPYKKDELDSATTRERFLRDKFTAGMPTGAEMRKSPPGAVNKNIAWEKRNKAYIAEWKGITKRLHMSGDLENINKMDTYGVSNVEMYRPTGGAQEMNMENAFISGREFHMPHSPSSVIFSDDEIDQLKTLDPDLASKLGSMTADARAGVKEILSVLNAPTLKILCSQEGGCGREVDDQGDLCWQHKKKDEKNSSSAEV